MIGLLWNVSVASGCVKWTHIPDFRSISQKLLKISHSPICSLLVGRSVGPVCMNEFSWNVHFLRYFHAKNHSEESGVESGVSYKLTFNYTLGCQRTVGWKHITTRHKYFRTRIPVMRLLKTCSVTSANHNDIGLYLHPVSSKVIFLYPKRSCSH